MLYLWLKALHLIAVVAWFAALFYLPRLFVYHTETTDTAGNERFKIMERKLYRGIATPAMIATIVLGIAVLSTNAAGYMSQGWMHVKLLLVVLLLGYHFACGSLMKKFANDVNTRSHIFYRWFNEFPVLILVAIVILVIVKPF